MRAGKIWWVWGAFVLLWTVALLLPVGATQIGPLHELTGGGRMLIAKGLHVCAYAVMTILSARLPIQARFRWLLMFLLMAHATVTELLQYHIPELGRTGELHDVGIDHLGILLGSLVSWSWWTREP